MAILWAIFLSACVILLAYVITMYISKASSPTIKRLQELGIKGPAPWPILGNLPSLVSQGFLKLHLRLYKEFDSEKMYYIQEPGMCSIFMRDLDAIRDVCIKNFHKFPNHRVFFDDEPFNNMLTVIGDERWKRVRAAVSPTFSTGKLKRMFVHIEETARTLLANLRQSRKEGRELKLKDFMSHFTMDVIASTGFGVKLDSINDRNNEFITQAKKVVLSFQSPLAFLGLLVPFLPKLLKKVNIEVFPDTAARYFYNFADEAIANRQKGANSRKRDDFLQLMIDAEERPETDQENNKDYTKILTRSDIQGQALIFILAGFDTVSTVLSFLLFLLGQHQNVCKKVQDEVDQVLNGKFPTYESVQELTYLDMCLNETLRMFPPLPFLDRVCKEECTIQGVPIPKGVMIGFPVMAIHYDPKIWPNPQQFDPERFSAENKKGRHTFAHIPFGHGPRNCIGMRLAILEIKVAVAAILQEMSPVPCEKSVYPVNLGKNNTRALDGLWVKFLPRN